MSEGESTSVKSTHSETPRRPPESGARGDGDSRPPRSDGDSRPPRSDGDSRPPRSDGDSRPPRPDREGRDERSRGGWSVKARLRAAARKKARKSKKKGMFQRRKVCRFCADKNVVIDYKEAKTLRLFISETGKMTPRRISGTCAKHQRKLAIEIKRARHIALLPFATKHI
jgi:small subunit ribosomal protein S18